MSHQPPKSLPHDHIRALRRAQEISQLDVATKLSISQSYYSLLERGYAAIPDALLRRIYKILGFDTSSTRGRSGV